MVSAENVVFNVGAYSAGSKKMCISTEHALGHGFVHIHHLYLFLFQINVCTGIARKIAAD